MKIINTTKDKPAQPESSRVDEFMEYLIDHGNLYWGFPYVRDEVTGRMQLIWPDV